MLRSEPEDKQDLVIATLLKRLWRIAGHVSRAMLSRDSHVRMEAKRRALDEIRRPAARRRREAPAGNPTGAEWRSLDQ
jgi:hypothetical protein